ncbi:MAG: RNA methyltransferase [Oscillospiraceae bacterium]|nr:RNA methyltransferase [Oscillospiraceae bacterium]
MDRITSRKNTVITHLRALGAESAYRVASGEYLCDGYKLLDEAVKSGAAITSILWKEGGARAEIACDRQYSAPPELFDYASPMKNSPGPLFSVRRGVWGTSDPVRSAIVLENVQDPGNVGTVLRTASAFSVDAVVLVGDCADCFSPKTVRATMGAIFRQRVLTLPHEELAPWLKEQGLKLYGAALSERATDVRKVNITHSAIAVGSEGHGLSRELLALCDGEIIIPMDARSESLNAAVAASVLMWEMARKNT